MRVLVCVRARVMCKVSSILYTGNRWEDSVCSTLMSTTRICDLLANVVRRMLSLRAIIMIMLGKSNRNSPNVFNFMEEDIWKILSFSYLPERLR